MNLRWGCLFARFRAIKLIARWELFRSSQGESLVLRTIQMIQQIPLLAFPANAGIHFCGGHRLFAGEAVLSQVLHRRVNRVNDSEH